MMPELTLAQVKKFALLNQFSFGYKDGEYRIVKKPGTEVQAYYTNDLQDAYGTMRLMLAKHNQVPIEVS